VKIELARSSLILLSPSSCIELEARALSALSHFRLARKDPPVFVLWLLPCSDCHRFWRALGVVSILSASCMFLKAGSNDVPRLWQLLGDLLS